jgi:hypothetical protein
VSSLRRGHEALVGDLGIGGERQPGEAALDHLNGTPKAAASDVETEWARTESSLSEGGKLPPR